VIITKQVKRGQTHTEQEIMDHVRGVVKKYGGKIMPRTKGSRMRVMFTRQLPPDVIAEMHPYFDVVNNKPSGTDIWINVGLLKKTVGKYYDAHEKKAVAGTTIHEMCHACHFLEDPDDYEKRMHSGYHYKKCFQKAGKPFKKYYRATNNDIVVDVEE
jgi:hypothetical protein